jgi:hypothetical protein
MKVKFLSLATLLALGVSGFAGDLYRINKPNSLVTAERHDLATLIGLNDRGVKPAVKNLYRQLQKEGTCFNLQPGAEVDVVGYFPDGTAKIVWANGAKKGFINKDDLGTYLGSNDYYSAPDAWANDVWENPGSHNVGFYDNSARVYDSSARLSNAEATVAMNRLQDALGKPRVNSGVTYNSKTDTYHWIGPKLGKRMSMPAQEFMSDVGPYLY